MNSNLLAFLCKALVYMISLFLSFYAMKSFNFEKLIKKNHVQEAQLLYALLVIALAYLVGQFFLGFLYFV